MRHPLPYAFARSHQLLLEDDGQQLTLWHSDQPDPGAWGEVLRLHQGSPKQVAEMLLSGEADIGVATEALAQYAELVALPSYRWTHAVVVPQGHELAALAAQGEALTLEQLARYRRFIRALNAARGAFCEDKAVMAELGQPMEKAHTIMERWGYTGSACIPMCLDDAALRGRLRPGDRVLLCASGGGVAMAAAVFVWTAGAYADATPE